MSLLLAQQVLYENDKFTDWDRNVLGQVRRPGLRFSWPFSRKKKPATDDRAGMAVVGPDGAVLLRMSPLESDKSIPDLWVDDPTGVRLGVLRRQVGRLGPFKLPKNPLSGSFDVEDATGRPLGAVTGSGMGTEFSMTDSTGTQVAVVSLTSDDVWHVDIAPEAPMPYRLLAFALAIAAEEVHSRIPNL